MFKNIVQSAMHEYDMVVIGNLCRKSIKLQLQFYHSILLNRMATQKEHVQEQSLNQLRLLLPDSSVNKSLKTSVNKLLPVSYQTNNYQPISSNYSECYLDSYFFPTEKTRGNIIYRTNIFFNVQFLIYNLSQQILINNVKRLTWKWSYICIN